MTTPDASAPRGAEGSRATPAAGSGPSGTDKSNEFRIMYVCTYCADTHPENCGHYDRHDLALMPNGDWLCEGCFEAAATEDQAEADMPCPPQYVSVTAEPLPVVPAPSGAAALPTVEEMAGAPPQISGLAPPITRLQQDQLVRMLTTDTEASRKDGFLLALASLGFVRHYTDPEYGTFWTLTNKGRARASVETAFRQPPLARLASGARPVAAQPAGDGAVREADPRGNDGVIEDACRMVAALLAAIPYPGGRATWRQHAWRRFAEIVGDPGRATFAALASARAGDGWRPPALTKDDVIRGLSAVQMALNHPDTDNFTKLRICEQVRVLTASLPAPPAAARARQDGGDR